MSETATHKNPYLTIKGDPESKFPPIILGNTSGCHYQSYIPEKDIDIKELLKRDNGDNVNPFPVGFFLCMLNSWGGVKLSHLTIF